MDNLKYIKGFQKISVSRLCKQNNIDRSNLLSGRSVPEKEQKIKEEIEKEIAKLYLEEN